MVFEGDAGVRGLVLLRSQRQEEEYLQEGPVHNSSGIMMALKSGS
jgi:hypothetical protein